MRYIAKGGIPATVETVPNPYAGKAWAALIHRADGGPAPQFRVETGYTPEEAAAAARAWLGGVLVPETDGQQ